MPMQRAEVSKVFIGAGSNVEPAAHLKLAVEVLGERYGRLSLSSVYQNPPIGFQGDDFLNMVIGFQTEHPVAEVMAFLAAAHDRVGRVAGQQELQPRTLDLDLLLFGELVDPRARVPRADVLKYGFVLGPLAELEPQLRHPVTGITIAAAWASFDGPRQLENRGPVASLKAA